VSELNISWREFLHWQAYFQLEPPDAADNYRTAMVLAQITNMSGKSLAKGKTSKPEDFLAKKVVVQSAEDQKAFLRSLG